MSDEGIDIYIEIGPGKALTGFIKKELTNANIVNIFDVDTLETFLKDLADKKFEEILG